MESRNRKKFSLVSTRISASTLTFTSSTNGQIGDCIENAIHQSTASARGNILRATPATENTVQIVPTIVHAHHVVLVILNGPCAYSTGKIENGGSG